MVVSDWDPESYARFRDLRLRPALDLLMQVGSVPGGDVIDLGCGDGAAATALQSRYPKHRLLGVDNSPAMLAKARGYHHLVEADAALWRPDVAPVLIFANSALHWLSDHARLMPRLAGYLAPGGVLAVQMPRQYKAPSHRFLRDIAAAMFPDRFDFAGWQAPVGTAESYARMLETLGQVQAWQTDYVQRLAAQDGTHPVRHFTEATAMRPFVERLTAAEVRAFVAAYEEALAVAYPSLPDGSVLMPFRRIFFVLKR